MTNTAPQTGTEVSHINFSSYSTSQLHDLLSLIDPASRPHDHAGVLAEIERRNTASQAADELTDGPWKVRFTTRGGVIGWWMAVQQRMPLFGDGLIAVEADCLVLHGWRRNWLGMATKTILRLPFAKIRNVVVQPDGFIRFDHGRWGQVELHLSPGGAAALAPRLPGGHSAGFDQNWAALRAFSQALEASGRYAWVTYALVLLNIAIFAAMAVKGERLSAFNAGDILAWGGNYGPLTASGEWWRLLSTSFMHLDWLHLAVNMWALVGVGRLTERLYGRWRYGLLYLVMAVMASLASLLWNPTVVGVGASGAIYGVFGLFIAYLLRHYRRVPGPLIRSHWLSSLVFLIFSLTSGFLNTGIDNAAHVGGLLAGLGLGSIAARPLGIRGPERWSWAQGGGVLAVILLVFGGSYAHMRGTNLQLAPLEQYMQAHAWYVEGGSRREELWMQLVQQSGAGQISPRDLADQIEKEILPFWRDTEQRLLKEDASLTGEQTEIAAATLGFVRARRAVAQLVVDESRNALPAPEKVQEIVDSQDVALARMEVLRLRAAMSHVPSSLASNTALEYVHRRFFGDEAVCVEHPPVLGPGVADTDRKDDGPALFHAISCQSQREFLAEDYEALEGRFTRYLAKLSDLPDGGSSLNALIVGLDDLISYGNLRGDQLLGRIIAWRRSYPNSLAAAFVEVMAYDQWAWNARGHDYASGVTAQAMAAFKARSLMAATVLNDIERQAINNPVWYSLSMSIGLSISRPKEELRAIFDKSAAAFPEYYRAHHAMMRILMPRWLGSFEEVRQFIEDMAAAAPTGQGDMVYARLYWMYLNMENDDLDMISKVGMRWRRVLSGLDALEKQYPTSDFWINVRAAFACRVNDDQEYARARIKAAARLSRTGWTRQSGLEECDKKFADAKAASAAAEQTQEKKEDEGADP